jgi:hypothetical protein
MLKLRADLLVNLAHVLRAGGDEAADKAAIGDAIALYHRKGERRIGRSSQFAA